MGGGGGGGGGVPTPYNNIKMTFLLLFSALMIASCSGDRDKDKNLSPVGPGAPAAKILASPAVSGLGTRVQDDDVVVTWNSAGSHVTDYRVQWNKADQPWNTWRDHGGTAFPTGTSHTIQDLAPGSYKIRARARINKKGGPWTSHVVATIPEPTEQTEDPPDSGGAQVVVPEPTLTFIEKEDDPLVAALATVMTDSLALIALYNSTDGPNWTTPWVTSQPFSQWYGVSTSSEGRVFELRLASNDLSGTIPAALGDLGELTFLKLNHNGYLEKEGLTGGIPAELGNLTKLTKLYLQHNELSGAIPAELGNLTKLEDLQLNHNELSGAIPSVLGNFTFLKKLYLNHNELSGTIPGRLGDLTDLEVLSLYNNRLNGSIPAELGNLDKMYSLNLSHNQLTGTVPAFLSGLTALSSLYLSHNQLTGTIPSEWRSLERLYLDNNQLTGTIPPELGDLNLAFLDLSHNQLTGTIPRELSKPRFYMRHLNLSHNQLSGEIPAALGNFLSFLFGYLNLSHNQLTGWIPPKLGNLTNLTSLYLSHNQLRGCVPAELEYLLTAALLEDGSPPHDFGVDANGDCDFNDPGDTSGLNLPFYATDCCRLCTREPFPPENAHIIGDTNTSLTVRWEPPIYDESDESGSITDYKVQWLTVGQTFVDAQQEGREATVGATSRTHTITGLSQGTWYMVVLLAVNPLGDSAGSNYAWGVPGAGSSEYGQGR